MRALGPVLLGILMLCPTPSVSSCPLTTPRVLMHRALLVEDILVRVMNKLSFHAVGALARTCRSFTELALDVLWADRAEALWIDRGEIFPWELAHLMSDDLWTVHESPVEEGAMYTTLYVLVSRMARDVSSPS
jgi:hypothetical protein